MPDFVHRKFRSTILGLLSVFFVGFLASSHVYVASKGSAYSGYLLAADHIFEVGVALILLALCTAVGAPFWTVSTFALEERRRRWFSQRRWDAGAFRPSYSFAVFFSELGLQPSPWSL
jgi:hypothetical protein